LFVRIVIDLEFCSPAQARRNISIVICPQTNKKNRIKSAVNEQSK